MGKVGVIGGSGLYAMEGLKRFKTVKVKTPFGDPSDSYISGTLDGIPVTVMATGMGPDNTEIALVELSQIVDRPTVVRIGSSGGLRKEIRLGDLVVSTGAVRLKWM